MTYEYICLHVCVFWVHVVCQEKARDVDDLASFTRIARTPEELQEILLGLLPQ
jgi:hypothetical protein